MREGELGDIFLRHLVAAVTWGAVLLIVFFIMAVGIKQEVKEGIQYTARNLVGASFGIAAHPKAVALVKQNVKEGIEFVAKTARAETKNLLHDPEVKRDLKDILETRAKP